MRNRTCYPRPDMERKLWMGLNGTWRFAFDDADKGLEENWAEKSERFGMEIEVPFAYQSKLSQIGDPKLHPVLWYARTFRLPASFAAELLHRILLRFGAVDWHCDVWINGQHLCTHDGGYTPFSTDITHALRGRGEEQVVVLRVVDTERCDQPRGKQYWKEDSDRCWYTACSGIWQSVWLEAVPQEYVESFAIIPDLAESAIRCALTLNEKSAAPGTLEMEVFFGDRRVTCLSLEIGEIYTAFSVPIREEDRVDEIHYWSPENPCLYRVSLRYRGPNGCDGVETYFGMRSIRIENGRVLLNNRPFYQRLLLHQGYYEGGLLTAEKDDDYRRDLQLIKDMGFNGIRMHQKVEDPLLYYWADRLGLVVWGELPSCYDFNPFAIQGTLGTLNDFVARDRSHPCIICWVPFNESWGLRNIYENSSQQLFAKSVYLYLKAIDPSRLVSTNDGWEQVESDLCSIHDYAPTAAALAEKWEHVDLLTASHAQRRMVYARSCRYEGQPILLSEFGGIAYKADSGQKDWGYCGIEKTEKSFMDRLSAMMDYVRSNPHIQGFCYTQFTDVAQEVNGLTDISRKPKIPMEVLRRFFASSV